MVCLGGEVVNDFYISVFFDFNSLYTKLIETSEESMPLQ
jgi:hypothetical protein